MSFYYAMLDETHRDIKKPSYIIERSSIDPPIDRLHYRDGNSHSSPSFRKGIPVGPDCIEISKGDALAVFAHWKSVWFSENEEFYRKRDEALAKGAVTYYAKLGMVYPTNKMDPDGILRRVQIRENSTSTFDEELRRGHKWYPTEFFNLYRLGHIDDDYEELSLAEAEEVIPKWPENIFLRRKKS